MSENKSGEGVYNTIVYAEMEYDEERGKKVFDFSKGLDKELGDDWEDRWKVDRVGYLGKDKDGHLITVTLEGVKN